MASYMLVIHGIKDISPLLPNNNLSLFIEIEFNQVTFKSRIIDYPVKECIWEQSFPLYLPKNGVDLKISLYNHFVHVDPICYCKILNVDQQYSDIKNDKIPMNFIPGQCLNESKSTLWLYYSIIRINSIEIFHDISQCGYTTEFISEATNPPNSSMLLSNAPQSQIVLTNNCDSAQNQHVPDEPRRIMGNVLSQLQSSKRDHIDDSVRSVNPNLHQTEVTIKANSPHNQVNIKTNTSPIHNPNIRLTTQVDQYDIIRPVNDLIITPNVNNSIPIYDSNTINLNPIANQHLPDDNFNIIKQQNQRMNRNATLQPSSSSDDSSSSSSDSDSPPPQQQQFTSSGAIPTSINSINNNNNIHNVNNLNYPLQPPDQRPYAQSTIPNQPGYPAGMSPNPSAYPPSLNTSPTTYPPSMIPSPNAYPPSLSTPFNPSYPPSMTNNSTNNHYSQQYPYNNSYPYPQSAPNPLESQYQNQYSSRSYQQQYNQYQNFPPNYSYYQNNSYSYQNSGKCVQCFKCNCTGYKLKHGYKKVCKKCRGIGQLYI